VLSITDWGSSDSLIFSGDASAFTSAYTQDEVSFNGIAGYSAVQLNGSDYQILAAIPEPQTPGLLTVGTLLGLAAYRRRRRPSTFPANH
jgi:hypothetical protein